MMQVGAFIQLAISGSIWQSYFQISNLTDELMWLSSANPATLGIIIPTLFAGLLGQVPYA